MPVKRREKKATPPSPCQQTHSSYLQTFAAMLVRKKIRRYRLSSLSTTIPDKKGAYYLDTSDRLAPSCQYPPDERKEAYPDLCLLPSTCICKKRLKRQKTSRLLNKRQPALFSLPVLEIGKPPFKRRIIWMGNFPGRHPDEAFATICWRQPASRNSKKFLAKHHTQAAMLSPYR